jgi:hypothetical protein
MAKDKTIIVDFDNWINGVDGNQGAFTVTGKRYRYVNGPLIAQTYPVISTQRPMPPMSIRSLTQADLTAGTSVQVAIAGNIALGSVEG